MNNRTSIPNTPIVDRWLIIIAVMSATLIQVLDTTIVNVALPHMQGALGAAPDQISWTLTSYIIASAIFMPLTGYFTDRLGRKTYLLLCIGGFTICSAFCGAAQSLTAMVLFRVLQGFFGAGLVPLSQAIMTDIHSKEELGKAMAIWGIGVMVGPILGPTIGGYLTEYVNWRWIFYVNLPVGLFAFALALYAVPDTLKKKRALDWFGFIFVSLAIGATQFFLDRGNQKDWLSDRGMCFALFIAITTLIVFLLHNLRSKGSMVFDMRIFKDRNFTVASLLLVMFGVGLYGNMVVRPLLMENLLNYPVLTTGMVMAPGAICSMISMIIVGKLVNRYDPRLFITIGILLSVLGGYFCTQINQTIDTWWLIWPFLIQGFGMGMVFLPLSVIAFSTLPNQARVEAAGLYSLLRTFGSSIGIAITLTVLTRQSQIAWQKLSGFIQPYNPALYHYLQPLHLAPKHPLAVAMLGNELANQTQIIAYVNVYAFVMWSFLLMVPLVLLLKYKKQIGSEKSLITND
jgi:DHA2 family multidrug resistance protein